MPVLQCRSVILPLSSPTSQSGHIHTTATRDHRNRGTDYNISVIDVYLCMSHSIVHVFPICTSGAVMCLESKPFSHYLDDLCYRSASTALNLGVE